MSPGPQTQLHLFFRKVFSFYLNLLENIDFCLRRALQGSENDRRLCSHGGIVFKEKEALGRLALPTLTAIP
jgi:hypothetical protein